MATNDSYMCKERCSIQCLAMNLGNFTVVGQNFYLQCFDYTLIIFFRQLKGVASIPVILTGESKIIVHTNLKFELLYTCVYTHGPLFLITIELLLLVLKADTLRVL